MIKDEVDLYLKNDSFEDLKVSLRIMVFEMLMIAIVKMKTADDDEADKLILMISLNQIELIDVSFYRSKEM
ncbi:uncharacterized protein MELLADRAFT_56244 [Melampsora larici-populina 98AG31]|uniref:Uncharacterized protein n=1 Tax=Melampsora larici-populina (strain 98AG31 / pathotype 3-4-7) TaxID=747676 RepID=F4RNF9_MELLP|nr:uncharacterized protein MELLADRAFT_56244 [Melampsora larici-populina 98AG31]EGG06103.1 hypothetical protein MELLADRAFT_56244 [Melampsora larici-populina 98AG31]